MIGNKIDHVHGLQVAVAPVFRHGEHERPGIQDAGNNLSGASVEAKGVPGGEEEAEQHLEPANHGANLGHDEDETFGG